MHEVKRIKFVEVMTTVFRREGRRFPNNPNDQRTTNYRISFSDSLSYIALAWLPCRDLSVAMATAGVGYSVLGRPLRHADCSMADAVGTATHQQQQQ